MYFFVFVFYNIVCSNCNDINNQPRIHVLKTMCFLYCKQFLTKKYETI